MKIPYTWLIRKKCDIDEDESEYSRVRYDSDYWVRLSMILNKYRNETFFPAIFFCYEKSGYLLSSLRLEPYDQEDQWRFDTKEMEAIFKDKQD